jgi:hypothetical protein
MFLLLCLFWKHGTCPFLQTDEEDVEDNTKREKRVAVNNDAASIISAG